jgi:NTE family protein
VHTLTKNQKKIGIALGGGAARGWSHIGVINELNRMGIEPDIVCGTSIGALVGAAYTVGELGSLESWVCQLKKKDIVRYLDIRLLLGGGFVDGNRLVDFFRGQIGDFRIEELEKPFAAVATELSSGHELWLREGSLLDAVKASIAYPGLFTPVAWNEQWLVDGGLVNPVPVSLCRAMGADVVIAVNVNHNIVGKRHRDQVQEVKEDNHLAEESMLERISVELKQRASAYLPKIFESGNQPPGLFDVLGDSINIMQERIIRSRMAGDPPDIMIRPHLGQVRLMEFERAAECIEEGHDAVVRAQPFIEEVL